MIKLKLSDLKWILSGSIITSILIHILTQDFNLISIASHSALGCVMAYVVNYFVIVLSKKEGFRS